jgi:preprotein translocase subunit SecB
VPEKKISPPTKRESTDYASFLRGIKLIGLGLAECSATIDRAAYFDSGKKNNTRTISAEYKLGQLEKEFFDVTARFTLTVEDKMKPPKALAVECIFDAHFHCSTSDVSRERAERFTQSELRLILWPYFREFVSDISGKMAIPPLLIPLSAAE